MRRREREELNDDASEMNNGTQQAADNEGNNEDQQGNGRRRRRLRRVHEEEREEQRTESEAQGEQSETGSTGSFFSLPGFVTFSVTHQENQNSEDQEAHYLLRVYFWSLGAQRTLDIVVEALGRTMPQDTYEQLLELQERVGMVNRGISQEALEKKIPEIVLEPNTIPEEKCNICLENYHEKNRIRKLPCNHIYHSECIDVWLTKHRNACPLCRVPPVSTKTPSKTN